MLPFFSLPFYFLIVTRCTAHCHFNRVQVQTLPTEQAAPVLTDSFSRGYDPYTHACKARPLTTVGRTSLSVIIIIIPPPPALSNVHLWPCRPRRYTQLCWFLTLPTINARAAFTVQAHAKHTLFARELQKRTLDSGDAMFDDDDARLPRMIGQTVTPQIHNAANNDGRPEPKINAQG